MLDPTVIETDHQLEGIADSASGQLARHRWHWTLDETNPDRVSIREYARAVARNESSIRPMVNGYAQWLDENTCVVHHAEGSGQSQPVAPLQAHITRARMGSESAAAVEAVAKARGISTSSVRDVRTKAYGEARRVRDIARQLAEEHGTSIEEEAPKVAETIVRHEQAEQAEQAERAQKTDLRAIEAEREVMIAKRAVLKAIRALNDVDLDDDTLEMLADAHNSLKAASALLDARLSGKSGTDWDAELARLA